MNFIEQWITNNEKVAPDKKESVEDRIQNIIIQKRGVKIGASDPGKQRDAWGFVGINVRPPFIEIIGAQRWFGRAYLKVEEKVAQIHRNYKYDFQVVEINNTGLHAYEVLRFVKQLPIIGVTTSKDLNPAKFPTGKIPNKFPTMDKNDMVRWLIVQQQLGHLLFPEKSLLTPELIELQRQLGGFVEHKTDAGTIRYAAEGEDHDDLVMSLMLACWLARVRFLKIKQGIAYASGKYNNYEEIKTPQEIVEENLKNRWSKERSGFNVTNVDVTFSE